jgi:CSLREA domain-containing protein/MYXO-CTERM domain-containing protein
MTRYPITLRPVSLAALLACGTLMALVAPRAQAATLTVNTFADDANVATCSLRDAVLSVNSGSDQGGCVAVGVYGSADTISLPAGTYRLALGGLDETPSAPDGTATAVNTPDASIGDLDLLKSVSIVGAGSATTRIEWDATATDPALTDRIFHIFTTDIATTNLNVALQGLTLAGGKTFEVDLGADGTTPSLHYYLRRAGGALALGGAANVVTVDTSLSGADNANAGGLGGSTGGESGSTSYTLSLTDMVIDGNSAEGDGGGLYLAATTNASGLVVRNNTSTTNGGGVYNEANTSISNSTFSGNRAEGGGGLFLTGSNAVRFTGTTFSGNRAVGGGAISGRSGVAVSLLNSTLSGNLADDVGAGFYANGPTTLRFVTIAHNIASADSPAAGVGINTFPSGTVNVSLKNVLLAGNRKGWDPVAEPDGPANPDALASANCGYTGGASGAITSAGHNLSSDTSCTADLDDTTDLNNLDPKIGALANNGGATFTHALLAGSPALGAGIADTTVTTDQRGVTRDATPDIGAYEEPTPVPPTDGGGGCSAANGDRPVDPVLPALGLLGLIGLALRRMRRR